jgi:Rifampin ADP-ribosyl transferase
MEKPTHGQVAVARVSAVWFVPSKKEVGEAMNERMGKRKRRRLTAKGRLPRKKPQRYFHGGNFGLQIGECILPPSVTGVPQNGEVSPDVRRDDRIYMVKLFDQAAIWAAHHEYPRIYEVEVEGAVEDDPDAPGTAFQCEKARIVNVHKIPPEMLLAARKKLLL